LRSTIKLKSHLRSILVKQGNAMIRLVSLADNVELEITVSNKINFSIRALTLVTLYLTIITTITSFPNTVATFFGIAQFGNTNPWLIFAIIVLSVLLPSLWLWRRKWLKTTFEALEKNGT
jgi:Mg2+ and Co2+ transporter CorA